MKNSSLYVGQVKHQRYVPVKHKFFYGLMMMCVDLDELPSLTKHLRWYKRSGLLQWHRKDFIGPQTFSLKEALQEYAKQHKLEVSNGKVYMLFMPRQWWFGYNPVKFYVFVDEVTAKPISLIAEVHNTPWGERHCYGVMCVPNAEGLFHASIDKQLHVSPYNPMDMSYEWRFNQPGKDWVMHMSCLRNGKRIMDVTLRLKKRELTTKNICFTVLRYPAVCIKSFFSIYWQALRLWIKSTPIYFHPRSK